MESVIGNAVAADRPKMKSKEYRREMRRLQGELVGHAEVGPANRRQSVHRVRGTGLGGPGWHDPADHRADQSAGVRAHRLGDSDRAESSQMYVRRYVAHFPAAGKVAIFDRSWYNRAGVELVMGYCTPGQSARFLELVPAVEKAMVDNGIIDQVLAQRKCGGADPAAREPDRGPAQGLEAVPDRLEVLQPPVRLLAGPATR